MNLPNPFAKDDPAPQAQQVAPGAPVTVAPQTQAAPVQQAQSATQAAPATQQTPPPLPPPTQDQLKGVPLEEMPSSDDSTEPVKMKPADKSELAEIKELQDEVNASKMPAKLKEEANILINRVYRMAKRGSYSSEYETVSKYVEWTTRLPWGTYTQDNLDLENARQELEKYHYGLQPVKKLILEYLAVMKMRVEQNKGLTNEQKAEGIERMKQQEGSSSHAPVMCFVGLQGLGKTTIAKSIANAMNRQFIRIPMGGIGDISYIRGSSKTSADAEPGQVVKGLVRAGSMNPVILLDEIDKASGRKSLWADIMASLLEILDPQQNSAFTDNYIDYPIDLSQVFFITSCNTLGTLSAALLDRLDVIRFTSYSDQDKVIIASSYLFKNVLDATGLKPEQLVIKESVWPQIVRPMGYDSGIRQLERTLTGLARRVAYEIVSGQAQQVVIDESNVKKYLPDNMGVLG